MQDDHFLSFARGRASQAADGQPILIFCRSADARPHLGGWTGGPTLVIIDNIID